MSLTQPASVICVPKPLCCVAHQCWVGGWWEGGFREEGGRDWSEYVLLFPVLPAKLSVRGVSRRGPSSAERKRPPHWAAHSFLLAAKFTDRLSSLSPVLLWWCSDDGAGVKAS